MFLWRPSWFCPGAYPLHPLASIITCHNLNHHFYADNTQLLNSVLLENIHTLLKTTSDCYLDIKNWMTQNKFQLKRKDRSDAHQNKTKTPLFLSTPFSLAIPQSLFLTLSKALAFFSTAHCPWRTSSVKQSNPDTTSSIELVLSRSIFLPTEAAVKLATSLILSRLPILSILACLLPLSKAFIAYRAVLLASYWKKM